MKVLNVAQFSGLNDSWLIEVIDDDHRVTIGGVYLVDGKPSDAWYDIEEDDRVLETSYDSIEEATKVALKLACEYGNKLPL